MSQACRLFLILLVGCAFARPAAAEINVQLVAGGIDFLVGIEHAAERSGRLFLVEQSGKILIYNGSQVLTTPFLDLTNLVLFSGEQGLLGLAFHPDFSINGFFYINYIDRSGNTVIARYQVPPGSQVADPNSGQTVLTQAQPFSNHKGGQLRFGPDRFLYIALGDGGSAGDPFNNSQTLFTLLGKLLRIDVDSGSPYAIPPSNPFVNSTGARGEIWDHGLRNPWRFSFDRQTGDLFIADVGQDLWEEIDFEPANSGGKNYGWHRMEAFHCYNPSSGCQSLSLTLPILEYSHSVGCSITGGFRYHGNLLADHEGTYFFSDYCSGRIWGATLNADGSWKATQLLESGLNVTTFGEDPNGEIYLSHYAANGALYRLVPATSASSVLTLTTAGSGRGRISSSPSALDCGFICDARLATGTTVTLTATPDPGPSMFAGWSGDADCTDGTVTLSVDRHCIATFTAGFTDDPITPQTTTIKAIHITELRMRIDALRASVHLPRRCCRAGVTVNL
jgi:glucose/arabinose dehydrogenase